MKRAIRIDRLVIEATRMCNQACYHCMRGNCQPKYINKGVIDSIFFNDFKITSINEIFITGGEPFYNKDGLIYLLNTILNLNIPINSIGCITNGAFLIKKLWIYFPYLNKKELSLKY